MPLRYAFEEFIDLAVARAAGCGCITEDEPENDVLTAYIQAASDAIARVSGIRGRRTVVARPCRLDACWCDCCQLDAIPLGDQSPTVSEVKIDGTVLDPSLYELHPSRVGANLVRVSTGDRPPSWPSSQALWRPDTEANTFSITFERGVLVENDLFIQRAVSEVVCDLATESVRRKNELPAGTTTASLGGTNIVVDDDRLERIARGELGSNVARLLGLYSPDGRNRSTVWAPEVMGGWELNLRIPTS